MSSIRQMFNLRAVTKVLAVAITCSALMFAGDDSGARAIKSRVAPAYPDVARQLNVQGSVKLEVTVASNGAVRSVRVVGGHPLLAEAAVSAVKQWKYEAGSESKQIVDVKFNLK